MGPLMLSWDSCLGSVQGPCPLSVTLLNKPLAWGPAYPGPTCCTRTEDPAPVWVLRVSGVVQEGLATEEFTLQVGRLSHAGWPLQERTVW